MMPQYLNRFAELYELQGRRVDIIENKLWGNYGRMIVPIGPINRDYSISEDQARMLMKKIPGALMVRYTYGYQEPDSCEEWYAVICDEFKTLDMFRSNQRRQIKKGLDNCLVRQVDADFIGRYGYDIYLSAFLRYRGNIKPMNKNDFNKLISPTKHFNDIYHYWAVFHKNKLIAYSMIAIYGNDEADLSVSKFIPEYLNLYSHPALIYTLTEHYLSNLSMHYFNTGFRNIYHVTNVQDYYIKILNFKKKSLNLAITYHYLLQYYVNLTYSFRMLIGRANHKLEAIYILEEINRKCNSRKEINVNAKESLTCAS